LVDANTSAQLHVHENLTQKTDDSISSTRRRDPAGLQGSHAPPSEYFTSDYDEVAMQLPIYEGSAVLTNPSNEAIMSTPGSSIQGRAPLVLLNVPDIRAMPMDWSTSSKLAGHEATRAPAIDEAASSYQSVPIVLATGVQVRAIDENLMQAIRPPTNALSATGSMQRSKTVIEPPSERLVIQHAHIATGTGDLSPTGSLESYLEVAEASAISDDPTRAYQSLVVSRQSTISTFRVKTTLALSREQPVIRLS